jgi:prevent-host-death family protein
MRIKVEALRAGLAQVLASVRDTREVAVVLRHGDPVAAIISMQDFEELERLRSLYRTVHKPARREFTSAAPAIG